MWQGVGWFVVGLVVAGLAPSMWVLVAGRIVQGFGGGLLSVALYVVVGHCYPARFHPKMFGVLAAAWVVPSIIGPALTGLVVTQWGWRWIFLAIPMLAVPAALLVRPALANMAQSSGAAPAANSNRRIEWGGIATVALVLNPAVPTPVAMVGWGLAGLGMGLVYPTLSVLTLELSAPGEQGTNSSALQLCDSLFAVSP